MKIGLQAIIFIKIAPEKPVLCLPAVGRDARIVPWSGLIDIRLRLLSREFNVTPCPLNQTGLAAVTMKIKPFPPPSPSPLEGEGWGGGIYCLSNIKLQGKLP